MSRLAGLTPTPPPRDNPSHVPHALIRLLAAFALAVQCLPVRVCAFEYLAFGSSCHDGDVHESDSLAGHAPCPGDVAATATAAAQNHTDPHGDHGQCACESPKPPAERSQTVSPTTWVGPPVGLVFGSIDRVNWTVSRGCQPPDDHPPAPPPVSLPLLL